MLYSYCVCVCYFDMHIILLSIQFVIYSEVEGIAFFFIVVRNKSDLPS